MILPKHEELPIRFQISAIDYNDKGLFIELRRDNKRFEFGIEGIRKSHSIRENLRPIEYCFLQSVSNGVYKYTEKEKGLFHFMHSGEDGNAYAVIEKDDGQLIECFVGNVRFLDRITLKKEEENEINK
jgi:hypothetical protein